MSSPRRLTRGTYVGDVTALCALTPPTKGDGPDAADPTATGAHDTLLAGIGASLRWYDPFKVGGDILLLSLDVFPSARVHGILPAPTLDAFVTSDERSGGRAILVWGERRVCLVSLNDVGCDARSLRVLRTFPPLGHWIHDARPVAPDTRNHKTTVVVGLADNAVEQWSLGDGNSPPYMLRRVDCSARSMLYSLALRGDSMATLQVAGGTIFNEVQLWAPGADKREVMTGDVPTTDDDTNTRDEKRPNPWCILRGHEGSIMRVGWSCDGTRVFTTSDDRTARVWAVPGVTEITYDENNQDCVTDQRASFVAYGHGGRVWDCAPLVVGDRRLLVTACEDCAVRLWDDVYTLKQDTEPVVVLRGHRGRGVWRALTLRNPNGARVLATAGADASIKLWDLSEYARVPGEDGESPNGHQSNRDGGLETFTAPALPSREDEDDSRDTGDAKHAKPILLKAMVLVKPGVVFVGTDRGEIHEARAPCFASDSDPLDTEQRSEWEWRKNIFQVPCGGPSGDKDFCAVVAIASLRSSRGAGDGDAPLRVAVADASGRVTVIAFKDGHGANKATALWSTQVSPARRLLDVLVGGNGEIFTVAVGGIVKLWTENTEEKNSEEKSDWELRGVAQSPFRQRALCCSYRAESGLVVLGDQAGNVCVFDTDAKESADPSLTQEPGFVGVEEAPETAFTAEPCDGDGGDDASSTVCKNAFPLLAAERRAHGANSVSLVEIRGLFLSQKNTRGIDSATRRDTTLARFENRFDDVEIVTGGRDGRLCVWGLAASTPVSKEDLDRAARRIVFEKAAVDEAAMLIEAAAELTLKKTSPNDNKSAMKKLNRQLAAAAGRLSTASAAALAHRAPFSLRRVSHRTTPGVSSVDAAWWQCDENENNSCWQCDESENTSSNSGNNAQPTIVAGFRETDFVVRDLSNQVELLRVSCGGWHRPFSLCMDGGGETMTKTKTKQFAFAFFRNGNITYCARRSSSIVRAESTDGGYTKETNAHAAWHARALNVWSHGREVHTVALVPPPENSHDSPIGVLTGSEDGFVLRHVLGGDGVPRDPAEVGSHVGGAAVRAVALVPAFAGGGLGLSGSRSATPDSTPGSATPVRAAPVRVQRRDSFDLSYLLLTAGAKEVLHAWRVSWVRGFLGVPGACEKAHEKDGQRNETKQHDWHLRTSLLATRGALAKQNHAQWKKGCGFVSASVESDQRFMAIAGFMPPNGGGCVALTASSSGAVSAMTLTGTALGLSQIHQHAVLPLTLVTVTIHRDTQDVNHFSVTFADGNGWNKTSGRISSSDSVQHSGSSQLRTFASLRYHDRPVLSVAVGGVPTPCGAVAVLAASGATDGTIVVWDLTSSVEGLKRDELMTTDKDKDAIQKDTGKEKTADGNKDDNAGFHTVHPAHVTTGAHQSGVNAVSVCAAAPGFFVIASGGDDQVARCALFSVTANHASDDTAGSSLFRILPVSVFAQKFAHASAIKSVWLGCGGVCVPQSCGRQGPPYTDGAENPPQDFSFETESTVPQKQMHLATTSHDQRLRMWIVRFLPDSEITLTPSAGTFVECPEPEGVAGFIDCDGKPRVAVCGRGVQTFRLD